MVDKRASIHQGKLSTMRWSVLLVACRRLPCAAGPYPPTQSADHWGGQIYTAGQQARSGGCPSHGWPGSASLLSAHYGREREQERGIKVNRWLRTRRQDGPVIVLSPRWRGSSLTQQMAVPAEVSSSVKYKLNTSSATLFSSKGPYTLILLYILCYNYNDFIDGGSHCNLRKHKQSHKHATDSLHSLQDSQLNESDGLWKTVFKTQTSWLELKCLKITCLFCLL